MTRRSVCWQILSKKQDSPLIKTCPKRHSTPTWTMRRYSRHAQNSPPTPLSNQIISEWRLMIYLRSKSTPSKTNHRFPDHTNLCGFAPKPLKPFQKINVFLSTSLFHLLFSFLFNLALSHFRRLQNLFFSFCELATGNIVELNCPLDTSSLHIFCS